MELQKKQTESKLIELQKTETELKPGLSKFCNRSFPTLPRGQIAKIHIHFINTLKYFFKFLRKNLNVIFALLQLNCYLKNTYNRIVNFNPFWDKNAFNLQNGGEQLYPRGQIAKIHLNFYTVWNVLSFSLDYIVSSLHLHCNIH